MLPCVILAGGYGTRLRSIVHDVPKCLAPVGGVTFLETLVDKLASHGIEDIIFALGYKSDPVVELICSGKLPSHGRYRWAIEPKPLGTGGSVMYCCNKFGLAEFMVMNGDTYIDANLDLFSNISGSDLIINDLPVVRMAAIHVDDRTRFGGIETDDFGRVIKFAEKGRTGPGFINAGIYMMPSRVFEIATSEAFSFETDILKPYADARAVETIKLTGNFFDIGVPEDYARFCSFYER